MSLIATVVQDVYGGGGAELAHTGGDTVGMAMVGLALIAVGAGAFLGLRRPRV
jgi:LPXTG-motif cell wall-anchored protein